MCVCVRVCVCVSVCVCVGVGVGWVGVFVQSKNNYSEKQECV